MEKPPQQCAVGALLLSVYAYGKRSIANCYKTNCFIYMPENVLAIWVSHRYDGKIIFESEILVNWNMVQNFFQLHVMSFLPSFLRGG